MSQHSQHQSTARIRVPSGPFGLAEQGLLFEHFFLFQKFRRGGNAWNLFDFDNQSAAIFCVDTIKYYSIPSVPSGLEEVKTRPETEKKTSPKNLKTENKSRTCYTSEYTCYYYSYYNLACTNHLTMAVGIVHSVSLNSRIYI